MNRRLFCILSLLSVSLIPGCSSDEKPAVSDEKPAVSQEDKPAQPEKVRLKTNQGDIVIELYADKAPVTVENFKKYVNSGHYNGTVFHRIIDGFMIQGGGFANEGGKLVEKKTGNGIVNESKNGLKNAIGTIAMARMSEPNSATAQFFINVANNHNLDFPNYGGYAVFGKVIEGMDVVNKIKGVQTGIKELISFDVHGQLSPGAEKDVPLELVIIESATLE